MRFSKLQKMGELSRLKKSPASRERTISQGRPHAMRPRGGAPTRLLRRCATYEFGFKAYKLAQDLNPMNRDSWI